MTEAGLHLRVAGPRDGAPVVLVHGAWHAGWCWEARAMPWLAAQGLRAIAPDLRGHGQSPDRGPMWRNRIGAARQP